MGIMLDLRPRRHTVLCAVLTALLSALPSVCIAAAPYDLHLGWEKDPTTGITISWETSAPTRSIVQFGQGPGYGLTAEANPGIFHNVPLTGLEPNRTYHFRFGDGVEWSGDHTFRTAPRQGPFTFLVVGDTLADLPDTSWPSVAGLLNRTEGAFILHTGDLVLSGSHPESWHDFFELEGSPAWTRPLMPCMGNHEENAQIYFDQFALPDAEQWYSFDYGNAHFVSLSTENDLRGPQLAWLREDLSSTNATWKIVYFHKPPYCSSGGWENVRKTWCPLFDAYHVDLVFNGHIHVYERTKPIRNGTVAESPLNGTIYIIAAGGGAHLGSVTRQSWIAREGSFHHFLKLSVDGNTLTCQAILPNGSIADSFTITKPALPDLAIGPVRASPTYPRPGERAEISIWAWNRGTGPSPPFNASVHAGGTTTRVAFPALVPGESALEKASWAAPWEGEFNLTVVLDEGGAVDEGANEDNNRKTIALCVSEPKPDLAVVAVEASNPRAREGDEVTFTAEIANTGRADAASFNVSFETNPEDFSDTQHVELLRAGQTIRVQSRKWKAKSGRFDVVVRADAGDSLQEYVEENNLSLPFYILDFAGEGPASYPRGCVEGKGIVIRYNATAGKLPPDTPCCTILWGINGWKTSGSELWPPGSATTGPLVETPMERGVDGLWYVTLPTDQRTGTVQFKFRDRHMMGRNWDDNEGKGWAMGLRGWMEGKLEDLRLAMAEAKCIGYNTSEYESLLQSARSCLDDGVYLPCSEGIDNATRALRSIVIRNEIQQGWALLDQAKAMSLDVAGAQRLLERASDQLEEGLIDPARYSVETATSLLRNMIKAVPETGKVAGLLLLSLFIAVASSRSNATACCFRGSRKDGSRGCKKAAFPQPRQKRA